MDGDPWSGDGILSTSFPNTVFITASVSQRGRSSDGSTVSLVALLVAATMLFNTNDCDCDFDSNPNFDYDCDCDSDGADDKTSGLERTARRPETMTTPSQICSIRTQSPLLLGFATPPA